MTYVTYYNSPIGRILLSGDDNNLTGLRKIGQDYCQSIINERSELAVFTQAKEWLDAYFDGQKPSISSLALAPHGSAFQQDVWNILGEIPYGELVTYGEIAKIIAPKRGMPKMSAQAIGGAVGSNPIAIILPCHRVIGQNGNLTGYNGGIETKIKLLQLEGVDTNQLFYPR